MSVEENKAIVKQSIEKGNKGSVDAVRETVTHDYCHHWKGGVKSIDDLPFDWQTTIEDMMAEGDRVSVWGVWSKEGRDRKMNIIYRLSGGKIAETWNITSLHGCLQDN